MDKRLILSVLLVMLSWEFMATYAQTTTEAPSTVTSSTNLTTTQANDVTTATPAPMTNATTATPSPTTSATTTTPSPTTSATTTTPSPTSSATTTTPSPTTSATTTTPSPTTSATTAASLNIPSLAATLSRQDCGSLKLCAAEPSECDPSTGDNCNFLSAKRQSGQTYNFELSGQKDGYVAAGLSTTTAEDGSYRAYICANNNGAVRFYTGTINNRQLVLSLLDSSNERGTVSNGKIQCTFTAVLPDTSTRAAGYALSVLTGSFNPASEEFGTPSFKILTPLLNLLDPTSLITNLLTSSAYPLMHTQSFLPVMLVSMCMLAFTAA